MRQAAGSQKESAYHLVHVTDDSSNSRRFRCEHPDIPVRKRTKPAFSELVAKVSSHFKEGQGRVLALLHFEKQYESEPRMPSYHGRIALRDA